MAKKAKAGNFKQGVGRLSTDRFDFESHLKGENPTGSSFVTGFRHKATDIDIANPSLVYNASSNVEEALQDINDFITLFSNTGQGFITVGDGYNTWHNANNIINFDPSIPALDEALNPIFRAVADGYDGYQLLDSYKRIQNGGIVVIKAGTYIVKNTIEVPSGITIMGEGYGTKIVNATGLTIPAAGIAPSVKTTYIVSGVTATNPIQITTSATNTIQTGETVVISSVDGITAANGTFTVTRINSTTFSLDNSSGSGTWGGHGAVKFARPVFKILADTSRSLNDAAIDPNLFMFSKSTKIMNLVIADNFVENTVLSDLFYKLPQNKSAEGLILQQSGSNLEIINCYLIGRVNFSSGTIVSQGTSIAIKLDTENNITTGTYCKILDSFIDGFSLPVNYLTVGGVKDYLEVQNCKIRSHGYYLGNGIAEDNNNFFTTNDCNVLISNNNLYGNHDLCNTILYIYDLITTPAVNAKSRMQVSNNNFVVTRAGATSITPLPYYVRTAIASTFNDNGFVMAYGNAYDSTYGFSVAVGAANDQRLTLGLTTALLAAPEVTISGAIRLPKTVIITTTSYVVDTDGGVPDLVLLLPMEEIFNTVGSLTITFPAVTNGRILILKEIENDPTSFTVNAQASELIDQPDGMGYASSANFALNGSAAIYMGVVDTVNSVNKWVLLSKIA